MTPAVPSPSQAQAGPSANAGSADAVISSLPRLDPSAEAETIAYGAIEVVSTYGVPQAEYAAIRKAAGLLDAAHRSVLEVTGKDRHAFLNNFLTNQTWSKETKTGMPANTGVYAFLLNGKGRIVADMNVLETGESVLLETDARLVAPLRAQLEKFVFTEKVGFKSHVGVSRVISVLGPNALAVLQEAGAVMGELQALSSRGVAVTVGGGGVSGVVFRNDLTGTPGYHLIVPADRAADVWGVLSKPYEGQTNKRTLRPVGWAMFNACRIEAGTPLFGIDFTEESLPAETGLFERAVSVTKGCYLGQEVVARMYSRNQVAKKLVGLRIEGDYLPTEGAPLTDTVEGGGNVVGGVTSSTLSPVLGNAALALATVKRSHSEVGCLLNVPAESGMRTARVAELPFVK